jgi:hypothetical protein
LPLLLDASACVADAMMLIPLIQHMPLIHMLCHADIIIAPFPCCLSLPPLLIIINDAATWIVIQFIVDSAMKFEL